LAGGPVFPGKGGTKIEHMFGVARDDVARAPTRQFAQKEVLKFVKVCAF
jgi:hypothetical protein